MELTARKCSSSPPSRSRWDRTSGALVLHAKPSKKPTSVLRWCKERIRQLFRRLNASWSEGSISSADASRAKDNSPRRAHQVHDVTHHEGNTVRNWTVLDLSSPGKESDLNTMLYTLSERSASREGASWRRSCCVECSAFNSLLVQDVPLD